MDEKVQIFDYERIDDLHCKGLKVIQNPNFFCFGIDAVLLSGFARGKKGESILDLGTGTGVIPILLSAKTKAESITALEIQQDSVEMAQRSVALNGLQNKIKIIQGDIKEVPKSSLARKFHVVTSNPPYMNEGGGLVNPDSAKAIARHEILCSLEDVICAASMALMTGGRFYMVHRPHRLADIIVLCRKYKLEPKRVRFVHPFVDKAPTMVLIEAGYGANPMIKVEAPLVIYKSAGEYTEEIYHIYYEEGQV